MSISGVKEGFSYLESFTNLEKKVSFTEREYRLDRVRYLFERFGNPHEKINIIHIAGSKGKGSTAAFASSILERMGFITGLYSSPHVSDYRERITLAGKFFPDQVYIENINRIKLFLERNSIPFDSPPTTFELLTLLAFLVFDSQKAGWAVIETGIGGRLDATNIVTPRCSVITPIEVEHSDILGDTIEKIASEKAGIIKKGVPVVISAQPEEAYAVIREKAKKSGSLFLSVDKAFELEIVSLSFKGTTYRVKNKSFPEGINVTDGITVPKTTGLPIEKSTPFFSPGRDIETSMTGSFQAENSFLAANSVKTALIQGNACPGDEIYSGFAVEGIASAKLPGRIEYHPASENCPAMIIDSSHTPGSVKKLTDTIDSLGFRGKKVIIYGSVEGKEYRKMCDTVVKNFGTIIVSRPGKFKKSNPEEVYNYMKGISPEGTCTLLETEPDKAFDKGVKLAGREGLLVVTGSFYMAGEIKKIIQGGFCGISAQ